MNDGKTLRIPIEAFKFPSNDEVEFMALIKPCQKQCEPAQCIDDATQIVYNSFGKRRRRRRDVAGESNGHLSEKQGDNDVLVYHRININDIFSSCPDGLNDCKPVTSSALAYQTAQRRFPACLCMLHIITFVPTSDLNELLSN
jgi:DNA polymerase II small subunit/DNA polymerase delta subunit B